MSNDVRVKLSNDVTEASCRRASKSSYLTTLELRRVVEERYVYMHYIYDSCYYSDAPSFERCTCNSVASNGSGKVKPSRSTCWKAIFTGFQLAEGLEKLSRGRKTSLTSGWTLEMAYAPHIQDLTSGLEKLRSLCEAYAKTIKRDHKRIHVWSLRTRLCICAALTEHKETSVNDESIEINDKK